MIYKFVGISVLKYYDVLFSFCEQFIFVFLFTTHWVNGKTDFDVV